MDDPISDNNVSTTNEMSDAGYDTSPMMVHGQQQCWDLKEEEEVAELPEMTMGLSVGFIGGPGEGFGGANTGNGYGDNNSNRRFRSRLGSKGIGSGPLPYLPDSHGKLS